MNILEKVKQDLELTTVTSDHKLQEYIDLFCNKINSICNRVNFPEELEYLAVDFAKKNYLYYKNKDDFTNETVQVVSASDNGQTVNFKTTENITKDDIDINKVIASNIDEISMYAYMRW